MDYTSLTAKIISYRRRGGDTAFAAQTDGFIELAEAGFDRDLRSRHMELTTPLTTDASGNVALPADYIEPISMSYENGGLTSPLPLYSAGAQASIFPIQTGGEPFLASITANTINIQPIAARTLSLTYLARFEPLTGAEPTNWIIQYHPDLYLYGCLYQAAMWLKSFEDASVYKAIADGISDDVNDKYALEKYAYAPVTLGFVAP